MPNPDALHWNTRYTERDKNSTEISPRPFLVEQSKYLPPGGLAIDIAAGLGGSGGYLLSRGFRVIAVDISEVGARLSTERFPGLQAFVIDLNLFKLPENTFDVILNFYYLQRDMWPSMERALRPGGVLFFETMTRRMLDANPKVNPQHLLAEGELSIAFPSLTTLFYEETAAKENGQIIHSTARLVARRPKEI